MLIDSEKMKEMLGRRVRNLRQLIEIEDHKIEDLKEPMTRQYFGALENKNKLVFQLNTTIEFNSILKEYEHNFKNDQ